MMILCGCVRQDPDEEGSPPPADSVDPSTMAGVLDRPGAAAAAKALQSGDVLSRRAGARYLASHPKAAAGAVADLLAALEDCGTRNEVAQALAAAGEVAVAPLAERLRRHDGGLRLAAAAALNRIASPRSRSALEPLARDPFPVVRHEAIAALEHLRGNEGESTVKHAPSPSKGTSGSPGGITPGRNPGEPGEPHGPPPDILPAGKGSLRPHAFLPVILEEEIRPALEAEPGHPLETIPIDATPGMRLEVAFGRACPPGMACSGTFRFVVELRDEEEQGWETIFERRLTDAPADRGWKTATLDLSGRAGARVRARLSVQHEPTGGVDPPPEVGSHPRSPAVPYWARPRVEQPWPGHSPSILLVSIDSLRADHLGCYGYSRPTSPSLDALSREGVRFAQAISQAPWTTPSHMSLLTSLYPSTHKVNQGWSEFQTFQKGKGGYRPLAEGVPTLASTLRQAGYRTLALTGGGTIAGVLGFSRGFDVYREDATQLHPGVLSRLASWLDGASDVPFFLFLHTFEVHSPYSRGGLLDEVLPPAERDRLIHFLDAKRRPTGLVRRIIPELRSMHRFDKGVSAALYDGGIRFTDDFLALLLDDLRARGWLDRMIVVVTSDHGEEFADHSPTGFYGSHGWSLFEELIHVPLLMRLPGGAQAGRVAAGPVELLDVAPTLLDLAGVAIPEEMQGRSLAAELSGADAEPRRWTWSEATDVGLEWKAMRSPSIKYILAVKPAGGVRTGISGPPAGEKLFDLREDPREQQSLHRDKPGLAKQLRQELLEHFRKWGREGSTATHSIELSKEQEERLRALGYIK